MKAVLPVRIALATALAGAFVDAKPGGPTPSPAASEPDLGFAALEDICGDSGADFRGALGFYTQEGTFSAQPVPSFGAAIDDVVIEWRECRLEKDATPCGGAGRDTEIAASARAYP